MGLRTFWETAVAALTNAKQHTSTKSRNDSDFSGPDFENVKWSDKERKLC